MHRIKKICLLTISLLFLVIYSYSQGPGNNGNGPPFPCPPNNPVCGGQPVLPLDGGVSFLFVLGTAYGIYELRKKNNFFYN